MDKKVIHYVFEEVARKYPLHIAIEEIERKVSYNELNIYANRLSHLLLSIGCKTDVIVNVVAPASVELVGAMLSIFKSGGIYLPVDLNFSEKRLAQLFHETFHGICIVSKEWQSELLKIADQSAIAINHLIVLDKNNDFELYSYDHGHLTLKEVNETVVWQENPGTLVKGGDSNYIFFTSGSTGEAKAIEGVHVGLSHFIHWEIGAFNIESSCRISQLTQATFDASLRDVFIALISGGTLCIPSVEIKGNPLHLLEWIEKSGITIVHCVPSLFRMLTKEMQLVKHKRYDLSKLEYVFMAGEAIFAKDIMNWRSVAGSPINLVNFYGATETTLIKTFYRIGEVSGNPAQVIPAGIPISNTIIAIINDGQICQPGEIGEIYIKTPFATKGYYRNEELTNAYFIQNPLQKEIKDIIYKTGDLGQWLPDGNLEVKGRKDSQIKLNGIRVELTEIEGAMLALREITGAIVKEHRSDDQSVSLIGYYTGIKIDGAHIRLMLSKVLSAQIIPSWFIWLQEFPLNINGKVDKKQLPLPEEVIADESDLEVPEGEIEQALAVCWASVLGHEKIGRNVSFFSIGGHSLRAIQLVSRISKKFGVKFKVGDVFSKTTIKEQGQLIHGSLKKEYQQITPTVKSSSYPLSHAQRRLWLLSQFEESNAAYNMYGVYVFEGKLNTASLEDALAVLIQRHEILRTVFKMDSHGEVMQFIRSAEEMSFGIAKHELRNEPAQNEKLGAALRSITTAPFELASGPLLRIALFRTEEEKWIFTYVIHHIISDAWSMGVLINELLMVYNGLEKKKHYQLPALKIQYKDYAAWQQQQMQDVNLEKHRKFWLSQFEGELPVLELPLTNVRPSMQTFNGARVNRILEKSAYEGLKISCQQKQSTLFMGLLACMNILLYKYTGQQDMVIGTPTAGREHLDLENQIGFYINTLALRLQLKETQSYAQILTNIKKITLDAFEHQAYPFDALVDDLQILRDKSRNTLYDVGITLQNTGSNNTEKLNLEDIKVSHYQEMEKLVSRSDLLFIFEEHADAIQLAIEYNSDLFDKEAVEQIALHFEQLMQAVILHPEQPVAKLDYLSSAEKNILLTTFNDTKAEFAADQTLVDLFEDQVKLYPEHTAVVFNSVEISYQELDEQANRLAHHLRKNFAIQSGDLVGILLERSEKMIIAILAILKSGAAYVPVDPEYPEARKAFIINDTAIKALITQVDYLFELDYYTGSIFAIDAELDGIEHAVNAPEVSIKPDDLAYLIYTSGSTGVPKGVMITHAGIANTINAQRIAFGIREKERGLQFASAAFDAAISEIFIILTAGATLYIIAENEKKTPALLERFITANRIDIATIPPAYLQLIQVENIRTLKKLITAGEAAVKQKVAEFALNGDYFNAYGPTETSICATIFRVNSGEDITGSVVPIGKPISNTSICILDDHQALVPVGVFGEICIGGKGLARGYLNNELLTTQKFVAGPFQSDELIYKTGDLGRWLSNGNIEFAGRKDNQVKLNGYRIELEEIEQVLLAQNAVKQVIALVKEDGNGIRNLILYYVPYANEVQVEKKISAIISDQLPVYMFPDHLIALDSFPLTSSGKVDRKKLPYPTAVDSVNEGGYVAPASETEIKLVRIWEEILGRKSISIKDSFFLLGGSSLKAMIVIKKIMDELGYILPINVLFDELSIENIAAYIESERSEEAAVPYIVPVADGTMENNASYNQLNYFSKWKTGNEIVVECYSYTHLDMEAFRWAVNSLVKRHEILRTVFFDINGTIKQRVLSPQELVIDIPDPVLVTSTAAWDTIVEAESHRTFNLAVPLLFAIKVYKIAEENYQVVATIHHILTDGYSAGIIEEELKKLYEAFFTKDTEILRPLPFQYRDFSNWQHHFLASAEGEKHRAYWLNKLEGFNRDIKLLSAGELACRQNEKAISIIARIEDEAYEKMELFVKEHGLTFPILLISSLTLFLHQLNNQTDVTLSATVSGRNSKYYGELDVSGLIGFFANALLLRNTVDSAIPVLEYLRLVQSSFLDDLKHDAYPFAKLMDEIPGITPALLQATGFFNYHNYDYLKASAYETNLGKISGQINEIAPIQRAFGLTVMEYTNSFQIQLKYNPDFFADSSPAALMKHFMGVVNQLIDQPELLVGQMKAWEKDEITAENQ